MTLTSPQQVLADISGQSVDLWHSSDVDISSGRQVLVFEASEAADGSNDYPGVAIDNVELLSGQCADAGTTESSYGSIFSIQYCQYSAMFVTHSIVNETLM